MARNHPKALFHKGDKAYHRTHGLGRVLYIGSGPRGDKITVIFTNPISALLGGQIVNPSDLRKEPWPYGVNKAQKSKGAYHDADH